MKENKWDIEAIEVKDSGLRLVFEAICVDSSYKHETKFMKAIRGTGFRNYEYGTYIEIYGEWLEVDPETVKIIFQEREPSRRLLLEVERSL